MTPISILQGTLDLVVCPGERWAEVSGPGNAAVGQLQGLWTSC
jgi:hypothetical protein